MVRKKGRRKIVCDGKHYVWYVLTGDRDYWERVAYNNWETPFLHIASEDKELVLTVPLKSGEPCVCSKGRRFQGRRTGGGWEHWLLPFRVPEVVTPKTVAQIIDWAERPLAAAEPSASAAQQ